MVNPYNINIKIHQMDLLCYFVCVFEGIIVVCGVNAADEGLFVAIRSKTMYLAKEASPIGLFDLPIKKGTGIGPFFSS